MGTQPRWVHPYCLAGDMDHILPFRHLLKRSQRSDKFPKDSFQFELAGCHGARWSWSDRGREHGIVWRLQLRPNWSYT